MKPVSMSCEEVLEQLFTFLDREVDDELQVQIERHLQRCRDCFSRADFERRLREKVAAAAVEAAPPRLQRRIRALLDEF